MLKKLKSFNPLKQLKQYKGITWSILLLAAPAIVEMALNTLLGVADMIMIGQLIDSDAIASIGFANQIMYLLIFTFSAFNTGAVAMVSRSYGEKDFPRLKRIAEQNVLLNVVVGLLVMLLAFAFKSSIFKIYEIEPHIFDQALSYFTVILMGFVPMFMWFAFASIMRGAGDTKTPMVITAIANGFNIIGNYVLITGWGPFPEMGVEGAALSTTLSRVLAVGIFIYYLYIKESPIKLKFILFIDREILAPLFRISLPGGIEQALMQLSFVVAGIFVSYLDTSSEAVFRILIQIESLSFMPAVGISIAAATLVGKSLGEKDIPHASLVGMVSSGLGIVWGLFVGILFVTLPSFLLMVFTKEAQVIALGVPVMAYLALNQPGLNFMIIMGGALRGAGDTFRLMLYTLMRLWIFFVPLSYLFILVLDQGVAGLWQAEILSIFIVATVVYRRFRSQKWADILL